MRQTVPMILVASLLLGSDLPKNQEDRLQGTWFVVHVEKPGGEGGREAIDFADDQFTMTFEHGKITATGEGKTIWEGTYTLDSGQTPEAIDITRRAGPFKRGIYQRDGDTLTLCLDSPRNRRPTKFTPGSDSKAEVFVFTRKKPR